MMFLFEKNLSSDIAIIAEIGVNHMGSVKWTLDFLPKLKEAGVDAVKFQLFTPNFHTTRKQQTRFTFLEKVALSEDSFLEILSMCHSLEMNCFATPVTPDWVPFIAHNCGVIKIASGDFTFDPIVKPSLESKATVIASTGGSSVAEIEAFSSLAKAIRSDETCRDSVALLHCISSYPPPLEESNLKAIPEIMRLTALTVGFSSHFVEDAPIYAALALGARIFEIHVTDDRSRNDIRDHALSRTPQEISSISSNLRSLNSALKLDSKQLQPSELNSVHLMRKGLIYAHDLEQGTELKAEHFAFARPFNPSLPDLREFIGKTLAKDVIAFYPVEQEDINT